MLLYGKFVGFIQGLYNQIIYIMMVQTTQILGKSSTTKLYSYLFTFYFAIGPTRVPKLAFNLWPPNLPKQASLVLWMGDLSFLQSLNRFPLVNSVYYIIDKMLWILHQLTIVITSWIIQWQIFVWPFYISKYMYVHTYHKLYNFTQCTDQHC